MARNPFWTYSLRLYGRPGVSPACIALQDSAGIDVNLLLFCLWAGHRRIALAPSALGGALAVSKEWRIVMQPLRQARRALKPMGVDGLRKSLLKLEVQAERLQQDRLHALVRTARPGTGEPVMVAADNLAAYFRRAGIGLTARDWPALRTIVRSGFA
jgi:uncharacterized protein (TIGR02444 family)